MRKKSKKTIKNFTLLDKIILGINIICALCLLLSYLAPGTDPRDYSIIAVLGFGYLPLVLVNIALMIYWAIRKKALFLVSLISILIGFNIFLSFYQFGSDNKSDEKSSADAIRMMAYNVRQFKGIDRYENLPSQNEIIQLISTKHPDIVNFEEFNVKVDDKGAVNDSLIKKAKLLYHYFKPYHTDRIDSSGLAIFTKYPIVDTGSISSPGILNTKTIFVDVKYENKIFRVYCVHLAPVTIKEQEKDKYLSGSVSLGSSTFISNKLSSAFIARSLQVSRIKAHMEKSPYPYIVAGDFNDTPNSFSVNELGDGLKNGFKERGSGFQTTYYSSYPLHIDHLFASPQFDVLSYQAVDKKISDHKPIICDLKLN